MPDSQPQPSDHGFLSQCRTQLSNVLSRSVKDIKSACCTQKGDLNVLTTGLAIGAGLWVAPWLFTVAGVMAVAGAALEERPEEPVTPEVETNPDPIPT